MTNNTIYIHIGTHKTGTSAIQRFLALNKEILERRGFLFPQQSRRAYYRHTDNGCFIAHANHRSFQKLARLSHAKEKNIILSSETFSLLENVSELKPLLADCPVKIICYLRRQDNYIQSMYNQSVKGGGFYQDIEAYHSDNLDYYEMLENWSEVFGKNNIIARVYEKEQLVNQDLIDDFLHTLGLALTEEYRIPAKNPNPRLSPMVLEYMRCINCFIQDKKAARKFKDAVLCFSDQKYKDATSPVFFDQSLLTESQRQSIIDTYHQSNALVAKEYLGREDGPLFYEDLPAADAQRRLQDVILTDELFLEMTRYLCGSRAHKKTLFKSIKRDVSQCDTFTKIAYERFLIALRQKL
jgi:hypothetical protein